MTDTAANIGDVVWTDTFRTVEMKPHPRDLNYDVVVTFTRYGQDRKAHKLVYEDTSTYVVAANLPLNDARRMVSVLRDVCKDAWKQGYACADDVHNGLL